MGRGLKLTLLLWETDKRFRLDSESCSDSVGSDIQDHLVPATGLGLDRDCHSDAGLTGL